MASPNAVSGARKAAIALMVLGEESSSSVFRYLHEDEIERVAREIASIGAISTEIGEQVLSELSSASTTSAGVTAGGIDQARRMLLKTLGPDHTRRILEKVTQSLHTTAGFASLERINPEQLSKFFLGEQPQTTALILAHLHPSSAAQLLEQLPNDMRTEVLLRLANLGEIPPDVVARVSSVIENKLRGLGGPTREQRGGVRAVAELFNNLDRRIGRPTLEIPLDRPAQRDPAVTNHGLNRIFRHFHVPSQNVNDAMRYFVVGGLLVERIADLDFVGYRAHALHALRRSDSRSLLEIRSDVSGQGDDVVVDGDADMVGVDARLECQLFHHVVA